MSVMPTNLAKTSFAQDLDEIKVMKVKAIMRSSTVG